VSDLERRLEDLFMHDSRSRRVEAVSVPPRRPHPARGALFIGATALAVLAFILAINTLRAGPPETTSLASPSASATASATASIGTTPSPSSSSAAPSPATARGPDAQHGFLSFGPSAIRTEVDARSLAPMPAVISTAAVSPLGKRVAFISGSGDSKKLVMFETGQPDRLTTLVDFTGTGEAGGELVWAADGSSSILFAAHKELPVLGSPTEYSALRSIDPATQKITEIARTTNGMHLVPLYWDPRTGSGAAFETGEGGYGTAYVLIRGGALTRTVMPFVTIGNSISADARSGRILAITGQDRTAVSTWRFDEFAQRTELRAAAGESIQLARWRPDRDEIVVGVGARPTTTIPPIRMEVWSLANAHRVLSGGGTSGLRLVRVDGTAALSGDYTLVDLETGTALGTVPRASQSEYPFVAVLF
jgi:hypothetical protein